MRRVDNWPSAFHALLEQHRRTPFAWGVHDCCQFARKGILAIAGNDVAADWNLPSYTTAAQAAAVIEQLGGLEALPARAGLEEVAPKLAQRGYVMLADFEGRPTLGLCSGLKSAFAGKDGLVWLRTLDCRRAWKL